MLRSTLDWCQMNVLQQERLVVLKDRRCADHVHASRHLTLSEQTKQNKQTSSSSKQLLLPKSTAHVGLISVHLMICLPCSLHIVDSCCRCLGMFRSPTAGRHIHTHNKTYSLPDLILHSSVQSAWINHKICYIEHMYRNALEPQNMSSSHSLIHIKCRIHDNHAACTASHVKLDGTALRGHGTTVL